MGMEEIIDISVTVETRTVSQKGFGIILLLAHHTKWTDLVREYGADSLLDSLVDEGFTSDDAVYKMGASILRSNPHVSTVKVGRAPAPAQAQSYSATVSNSVVEDDVVSVAFRVGNTTTTASHTLTTGEDQDDAATALAATLDAAAGLTASATGAVVTIQAADPAALAFLISKTSNVTVKDISDDQGYDDALDAISAIDDDYYGVSVAVQSEDNLDAMADWVETKAKLFFATYAGEESDYVAWLATKSTSAFHRTYTQYAETVSGILYPATEAAAYILSENPGSATLFGKELPGVPTSSLTDPQRAAIKAAKGNTYRTVGGANIIQDGWALSGRFVDITIAVDWITARAKERAFAFIISKKKVPYTDFSVSQIKAEVQAVLDLATQPGVDVLRTDPAPEVTAPKVADVSALDRANRLLPDVTFTGELAGAIQAVKIRGTLSL